MTHREFIRKYPEFRHLPEFITGAGDKSVRLMDATYADFLHHQEFLARQLANCIHYQRVLQRRIARRERKTGSDS